MEKIEETLEETNAQLKKIANVLEYMVRKRDGL